MDVSNKFLVGVKGESIVIGNALLLHLPLSRQDALLLAAYLVALGDVMQDPRFAEILQAVQNT